MNFSEPTVESEIKFEGRVITVSVDTVTLPDGRTALREIAKHSGGVTILPVDNDGYAYMVRQFRKPFDTVLLEAPAGKLAEGESHYDCGVREMLEETGFTSQNVTYLGCIYPSPGYSTEIIHLYLARDLTYVGQQLDEDEFLSVEKILFDDVVKMCSNNEITDAKTLAVAFRSQMIIRK